MKKYLKYFTMIISSILTDVLILTIFYYFNILNSELMKWLLPITLFMIIYFYSYKLGKHSKKNGFLEGIKISGLVILFFFILYLIMFRRGIDFKLLLYDLIIMITSILGSMIGINKVQKKE